VSLPWGHRRVARALLALLAAALIAYAAFLLLGGDALAGVADSVYNVLEFLAAAICLLRAVSLREERRGWILLALAITWFAVGDVYWTVFLKHENDIPVPSPADIGFLLFYPFAYAALVVLVRARADRFTPGLWLEGCIGSFAVAAIGAALLQKPIEASTGGSPLTVAASIAYPLADILLFSLVVGVLILTGLRHGSTWLVTALGFAVFAATDSFYGYQTAAGTYVENTILDVGWPLAFALFALAAWLKVERVKTSRLEGWQSAVLPGIFGLSSLGVLIYASIERVYAVAVVLAAVSLVGVLMRMALLVSQRMRMVGELGASEERYRALVRSVPDTLITLFDRDLRLVFYDGTGIDSDMRRALGRGGAGGAEIAESEQRADLEKRLRDGLTGEYVTHEISFPSTTGRAWSLEIGPYRPDGRHIDGVVCVARNVTGRREAERQLAHQALHDSLTGLANRVLFMDRLDQALARLQRHASPLALLFVDLDHFKVVNDSLGHAAGDELLVQVAERLRRALRPADTVARFGGDEFVILCEDAAGGAAEEIADRISEAIARPFKIGGQEVVMTASTGIVIANDTHTDGGALLRDADTAMYRAKERGRANSQVFDNSMRMRAVQRLELETALRRAIETDELRVLYQPQVRLADGATVACEALVRWQHPERGLIDPADFIPIAEESGLISQLGAWVLRHVAADMARSGMSLPVSVNVSPRQLANPDFVDNVRDIIAEGIETAEQAEELRAMGADYGQGWYFGRPRELRDLGQLVRTS
jgi:diguanylate cyclase (GGDEF)-like protein